MFFRGILALRTRFSHSFRRSGETEMEQLFQMATERCGATPSRAASLRNRDTPGQLADRYCAGHLERRGVDHADAVRAPVVDVVLLPVRRQCHVPRTLANLDLALDFVRADDDDGDAAGATGCRVKA